MVNEMFTINSHVMTFDLDSLGRLAARVIVTLCDEYHVGVS